MIYEKNKTKQISFPLGGIGTGCIGLSGNGELIDWEIFNHPDKNSRNGFSHFAIKATCDGKTVAKVLHGDTNENLIGMPCESKGYYGFGFGPRETSLAGFPHFKNLVFEGNFPIADLTFSDEDFPATVKLTAFNPFIPHDDFNSSLPAAFFIWEIKNETDKTIDYAIACSVENQGQESVNKTVSEDGKSGIFYGCTDKTDSEIGYCDVCVLTDGEDTENQEYWYRGGWKDGCTIYWKNFTQNDRMPSRSYPDPRIKEHGTTVSHVTLEAGQSAKLRFVIAWNTPIAYNYWEPRGEKTTWKNYYATQFKTSLDTAKYSVENFDSLYEKTLLFSNALQSCTLSESAKDAVTANLSVLKSPTVFRLEDGSLWGWEGCCETVGSCPGTCQHVWNYAYVLPYLFPNLERSIREITVNYALLESGATRFRVNLPLEKDESETRACLDGQMGEVIKFYREWKISGDNQWLKAHAESIFKMLEYAWSEKNPDKWDANMDGVLEGRQHHTLDMELFGPSSWLQGFYVLALQCGAEIADFIGDENRRKLYTSLFEKGKKYLNESLFNGEYFYHKADVTDKTLLDGHKGAEHYWNEEAKELKYQVADGCIIDQLLADWHSLLIGATPVFDSEKKKKALESLYKNNFKESMREVANMWRTFSLNDESGTIICSYPEGASVPAIPIPYCEETMTGFEYALAGLMISEGYITEGERMIKAVRDRYDGEKRNPWNEIECGNNYARSMASFSLLPIYSGFTFDMTKKHIGFEPLTKNGKFLFGVADTWGTAEFTESKALISILGKPLKLSSISVPEADKTALIKVDGNPAGFIAENGKITLGNVLIRKTLEISLKN